MQITMKKSAFIALSLILTFMSGCAQDETFDQMFQRLTEGSVNIVMPEELEGDTAITILDARELNEFQVSHIPGARLVGYDDFEISTVNDLPKDAPIVVYCSVGYRSEKIAEKLISNGFTNVSNLYGGIFYWVNTDHQVVDHKGRTSNVHAYNQRWGRWLEKGEKCYD